MIGHTEAQVPVCIRPDRVAPADFRVGVVIILERGIRVVWLSIIVIITGCTRDWNEGPELCMIVAVAVLPVDTVSPPSICVLPVPASVSPPGRDQVPHDCVNE